MLGPLSRLIFDQFARVSLKSTQERRSNLLDAFAWPSAEARSHLQDLPVLGDDLFHGEFFQRFSEEVKRNLEVSSASFLPPPKPAPSTQPRAPRSSRKKKQGQGRGSAPQQGRGSAKSSKRGSSEGPSGRGRGWGVRDPGVRVLTGPRGAHPAIIPMVGGRLRLFVREWSVFCPDAWVVRVISKGYRLEFTAPPPMQGGGRMTPIPADPGQREALELEILGLLRKGAIVRSDGTEGPLFRSSFFLVPKKGGTWRPILNLRPLNVSIRPRGFRMETLAVIIPTLRCGMWATSIDLRDAYLHVPIFPGHRRFLAFQFQGETYMFTSLPFGLSTAPRVFSRVAGAAVAELRQRGFCFLPTSTTG